MSADAQETHVEPHPDTALELNEATVDGAPAVLDVTPEAALAPEVESAPQPEPEPQSQPQPVVLTEAAPAPKAEVDIEAIISDDPNQIVAPPAKPKRGWWRR